MSRRAKFIIAAVFLVLLAIPLAFVAVTWVPREPPRFRVISMDSAPIGPSAIPNLVLEIENRSLIPIEIVPVVVLMTPEDLEHAIQTPKFRALEYEKYLSASSSDGGRTSLRGHQSIRLMQHLMNKPPSHLTRQGVSVHYLWRTRTRKRWAEFLEVLRMRFPTWFAGSDPNDTFLQGVSTIEMPDALLPPASVTSSRDD